MQLRIYTFTKNLALAASHNIIFGSNYFLISFVISFFIIGHLKIYFLIFKNVGISSNLPVIVFWHTTTVIRRHILHDFNLKNLFKCALYPHIWSIFQCLCAPEKSVSSLVKGIYLQCALIQMCSL